MSSSARSANRDARWAALWVIALIALATVFGWKVLGQNVAARLDGRRMLRPDEATALDAFGRLRTSPPYTLFETTNQYDASPLLWETVLTATGSSTHLPNESSVRLRVAASGDKVVRQSRAYSRYRPGKSLLVALTMVMGTPAANVRRRAGYFDASNGIFLEESGTTVNIVRRTFTSGAAVDNAVAQASWNVDKLDGTGFSGKILDLAKANILMVDLQWLGVGRVRVGFDIDGTFYPAHQFLNANSLSTVYMTTANLPLRYEVEATGAIGGAADLVAICSTVASEGGYELEYGYQRSSGSITPISVTTRRPVRSIRPKATFNSIVNRGQIIAESIDVTAATNNCYWELVYGGVLTGASFGSAGTNSIAETDVAATAISGGDVILSGFVVAGAGSSRSQTTASPLSRLPLTVDIAGANPIPLTLVATSFTGTCSLTSAITWRELW